MRLPIIGEIGVLDVLLFPIVYLLAVLAPLALAPRAPSHNLYTSDTRDQTLSRFERPAKD